MGRPRKPTALQLASGRHLKNPGTYRARKNEPSGGDKLGDPPDYIQDSSTSKARTAWKAFAVELPWLTEADRAMMEIASIIRGDVMAGQAVGVPRMTLLRGILQSLGASPADKSKVAMPPSPEEPEDDIFTEG